MRKAISCIAMAFTFGVGISFALDTDTHQYLNEDIVNNPRNSFSLDSYLKNQLGMQDGVKEQLPSSISGKSLKVFEWLRDGGLYEDKPPGVLPYIRSANHFHDPLTEKGFTGIPKGDSAIAWSQKPIGEQWVGGHYSWLDSRDNFYNALISTNKAGREETFAETFRGVGEVMHLTQDMSVPEHARNDFHALTAYEEWLADKNNQVAVNILSNSTATPKYPDSSLLLLPSAFSNATVPIANLFDTNKYTGNSAYATTNLTYGLSEYTNANFFSPDTILDSDYPFPNWSEMEEWDDYVDAAKIKMRKYLRKKGEGEKIEHVATGTWLYKYLPLAMKSLDVGLTLDEKVYADYATLLLPRAVGYSTALLDYFFRGKLKITAADVSFTGITLTAANDTPNENMATGAVALVVRYKPLTETGTGTVTQLAAAPADFTYKVVKKSGVSMSAQQDLSFTFTDGALPMFFSELAFQLVYRGQLGNELDSVAVSPWVPVGDNGSGSNGGTGGSGGSGTPPVSADEMSTYLDLALPTSGVYAKTSDNTINATFSELGVNVSNTGSNDFTGGTFELVVAYRTATADPFQSKAVATIPDKAYSSLAHYPLKSGASSLASGSSADLVFDLSAAPLSVKSTNVEIYVVYKVNNQPVAFGLSDISEPTPVDVFNNTDYTCANGQWYLSGSQELFLLKYKDTSTYLREVRDLYPHNITNIAFWVKSPDNTVLTSSTMLAPNNVKRLGYILTDSMFEYGLNEDFFHPDPFDTWFIIENPVDNFPGTAAFNNSSIFSGMMSIRNKLMWWGSGVVYDNSSYVLGWSDAIDDSCSWSALQ